MRRPLPSSLSFVGRWYIRHVPWRTGAELAVDRVNSSLREHPRRCVARTRCGARFRLDTQDLIQRYLYMFGTWEPHMTAWLQSRLRAGDTFVDVGSNIGVFAVLASRLVGSTGRVVAIEASPEFHRRVREHVELNGCSNVRAVHAAVSDRRRELSFVLASSKNMGANSIVPYDGPAESSFEIEALPLPALLEPEEIARARVMKIDVEGAEGAVVRGLVPMLDQLRPDAEITVEVTPDRMRQLGDSAEELVETMRSHGFHVYRLANDYSPESYPKAIRRPLPPVRWRGPVVEESDLVFSRVDAEELA
ncbi:FkbM family methyltransferase [Streptomyces sp. HNM0663]|uniref:FkbM family methyltransferase n=1 Tax=Streptomyces chengmaiensis TaxID=3040919 RepID=A0ABT6HJE4_9ACTN|nr:FkbM family methyltransferase [Streptomyces chengmaiensis]MDH2388179.1 FkbM family methyltransferase [Streptomyces chengmaiensis]